MFQIHVMLFWVIFWRLKSTKITLKLYNKKRKKDKILPTEEGAEWLTFIVQDHIKTVTLLAIIFVDKIWFNSRPYFFAK